jgi:hypothetical protein
VQSDAPTEQARRFFNGLARRYRPVHGDARALLAKQMTILLRHGDFRPEHTVVDPRHLPSDRMPVGSDAGRFAREAGLVICTVGYWPFVPCSDMPVGVGWLMRLLELLGRAGSRRFLWGGLLVVAVKPIGAERVE